jgi:hypothetical protein
MVFTPSSSGKECNDDDPGIPRMPRFQTTPIERKQTFQSIKFFVDRPGETTYKPKHELVVRFFVHVRKCSHLKSFVV